MESWFSTLSAMRNPAHAGERSSRAWNGSFLSVWISTSSALLVTDDP